MCPQLVNPNTNIVTSLSYFQLLYFSFSFYFNACFIQEITLKVSLKVFTLLDVEVLNPLKMVCTPFPDPSVQLLTVLL